MMSDRRPEHTSGRLFLTLREKADSMMPDGGPQSSDSPNPVLSRPRPGAWKWSNIGGKLPGGMKVAPPDSESPATLSASARSVVYLSDFRSCSGSPL